MSKTLKKKTSFINKAKTVTQKTLGILVVVLIVAFVAYHFYSVGTFVKNFDRSTGRQSSTK